MPYATNADLPPSVRRHLPAARAGHLSRGFQSRFCGPCGDPRQEEAAHRIAWAAVKRSYVKVGREWVARESGSVAAGRAPTWGGHRHARPRTLSGLRLTLPPPYRLHSRSIVWRSHSASSCRRVEAEVADAERHHVEARQLAGSRRSTSTEVHEHEIAAIGLVVLDALVVVEEVAAAVEDRLAAIDLDRLGVMRGMAVDDVDTGLVDEAVRERASLVRDLRSPSSVPNAARRRRYRPAACRGGSARRSVRTAARDGSDQEVDAGPVRGRRPNRAGTPLDGQASA